LPIFPKDDPAHGRRRSAEALPRFFENREAPP
jgi:hypothetical protein